MRTDAVFNEVAVAVTLQALDGLVGATQLNAQVLGTVEEVVVLVGQRGSCTQVAGSIGALRLEGDAGGLVGSQVDVAIQHGLVLVFVKRDVRVAHHAQSCKVLIGVLQTSRGIGLPHFDESIVAQHLGTQGNDRVLGRAIAVVDAAYGVDGMRQKLVVDTSEGMQHQGEIHLAGSRYGVGPIADIVLVEAVVAMSRQVLRDALALIVQVVHVEGHTLAQLLAVVNLAQQHVNSRILDVVVHLPHAEALAGLQVIDGTHLALLEVVVYGHAGTQITHIL